MLIADFFDIWLASPEFFFWFSLAFVFVFTIEDCNSRSLGYPILNTCLGWVSLFLVLCTLMLILTSSYIPNYFYNLFALQDELSQIAKSIILIIVVIWVLLSLTYIKIEKIYNFEFWILILIVTGVMFILVATTDLISLYLTIEIQALIFYTLASFKKTSEFCTEAGLKYFLLGALSSIILLLSLSLIYGLTGLTSYIELGSLLQVYILDNCITAYALRVGILLFIISFMFKIGAAPFHIWLPDVYEGSPAAITAFFATVYKFVILVVAFRIFIFWLFPIFWFVQQNFLLFVHLSLLVGSCGAFVQQKWKRFLAYSSIFHVGFLLLALANGTLQSLESFFFYILIYILTNCGLFSLFFSLVYSKNNSIVRYLSDLTMLLKTNTIQAVCLIIMLFSIAGIPPIAGFFAKFYILFSTLNSGFNSLFIVSLLFSCFSCFYYLRIIKTVCFETLTRWAFFSPVDRTISIVLSIVTLCLFFLFFNINSFLLPLKLITLILIF